MTPNTLLAWTKRYVEGRTLVMMLIVSGSISVFIALAGEVMEGETHGFDTTLLMALRSAGNPADPIGPGWLQEMVRDITGLGGVAILTLLTIAVCGFLWIQGKKQSLFLVLAATLSGWLMSSLLKYAFDRPRPDLVPHGSIVYTTSFPSGHSMLSAVVYLTLAALVARVQERRAVKIYIISVAGFLSLAVGFSRVYLGVHWPTDVLAGWSAGAAWALVWWMIANWLETRGMVEPQEGEVSLDAMSAPARPKGPVEAK